MWCISGQIASLFSLFCPKYIFLVYWKEAGYFCVCMYLRYNIWLFFTFFFLKEICGSKSIQRGNHFSRQGKDNFLCKLYQLITFVIWLYFRFLELFWLVKMKACIEIALNPNMFIREMNSSTILVHRLRWKRSNQKQWIYINLCRPTEVFRKSVSTYLQFPPSRSCLYLPCLLFILYSTPKLVVCSRLYCLHCFISCVRVCTSACVYYKLPTNRFLWYSSLTQLL